jgi:PEGA domain
MKRALIIVVSLISWVRFAGADSTWQYARIAEIKKSTASYTKAWVVNTPIQEDVTTYTISVQVRDRVIVGKYDLSPEYPEPPQDWAKGYAVKVQVTGDSMYLQSATGNLRLHITQRKAGRPMEPLTAEEKKRLDELEGPPQSLIGFSEGNSKAAGGKAAAPEPAPQAPPPPPAPPTTGSVNVRSTPYLSEVFVDGDSMGYTPAKIALPPGKHTFRVEKPGYKAWTTEMTITVGSELTLDASLEKK